MALQKHFLNYGENLFHSTELFMEDDKSTTADIAISFRYMNRYQQQSLKMEVADKDCR